MSVLTAHYTRGDGVTAPMQMRGDVGGAAGTGIGDGARCTEARGATNDTFFRALFGSPRARTAVRGAALRRR